MHSFGKPSRASSCSDASPMASGCLQISQDLTQSADLKAWTAPSPWQTSTATSPSTTPNPLPIPFCEIIVSVKKFALVAAALFLGACSKDIQNKQALKDGVVEYLNSRM